MSEQMGLGSAHESRVDDETVAILQAMSDDVLAAEGIQPNDPSLPPCIEYYFRKPTRTYGLRVISIASGRGGFNTFSDPLPEEDVSRRWHVQIDRGTTHGAAFDVKGVVYEHGGYEPSEHHENIDTGSIEDVLHDFYDDPKTTVTYELLRWFDDRNTPKDLPSTPRSLRLEPGSINTGQSHPTSQPKGRWLKRRSS